MKLRRCFVLLVLAALLLSGCDNTANDWDTMWDTALKIEQTVDDPKIRELTESMINAIIADEPDTAFNLLFPGGDRAAFDSAFPQLREVLKNMDMYTLVASQTNTNKNLGTGVSVRSIRYLLSGGENTMGEIRLFVDVVQSSEDPDTLASFYINVYEQITYTGTFTTMKGADAGQWIVLILGLLEAGFMVWMFVDCCAHEVRKKWLWLLLIALGAFVINVSVDNGVRLNFNVGLYFNVYTAAIAYSNGACLLRIMVPVGAAVYAAKRKDLLAAVVRTAEQPTPAQAQEEMLPPAEEPQQENEE